MKYTSTRKKCNKTIYEALVLGMAEEGGLFVPQEFPHIQDEIFQVKSYEETFEKVISLFGFTEKEAKILSAQYESFSKNRVEIKSFSSFSILELFHGPTCSFKDYALSVLPKMMELALDYMGNKKRPFVFTATSGDTGSAAMAGFQKTDSKIMVLYPQNGVSEIQKRQMLSMQNENAGAFCISGNFDDAQRYVKSFWEKGDFQKKYGDRYNLTFANSVNIGRIICQVVYYVFSYGELLRSGVISKKEEIDVFVPTGNFGNILSCHYAKKIGVPIAEIYGAVNENCIVEDFFKTGEYDTKREFYKTNTPAMDILVSSNLERYLFDIFKEEEQVLAKMNALKTDGRYQVKEEERRKFEVKMGKTMEEEVLEEIKRTMDSLGYLIDPHTGVALSLARKIHSNRHQLLVSTASPSKFPDTVAKALNMALSENIEENYERLGKRANRKTESQILKVLKINDQKERIFSIERGMKEFDRVWEELQW